MFNAITFKQFRRKSRILSVSRRRDIALETGNEFDVRAPEIIFSLVQMKAALFDLL